MCYGGLVSDGMRDWFVMFVMYCNEGGNSSYMVCVCYIGGVIF